MQRAHTTRPTLQPVGSILSSEGSHDFDHLVADTKVDRIALEYAAPVTRFFCVRLLDSGKGSPRFFRLLQTNPADTGQPLPAPIAPIRKTKFVRGRPWRSEIAYSLPSR